MIKCEWRHYLSMLATSAWEAAVPILLAHLPLHPLIYFWQSFYHLSNDTKRESENLGCVYPLPLSRLQQVWVTALSCSDTTVTTKTDRCDTVGWVRRKRWHIALHQSVLVNGNVKLLSELKSGVNNLHQICKLEEWTVSRARLSDLNWNLIFNLIWSDHMYLNSILTSTWQTNAMMGLWCQAV